MNMTQNEYRRLANRQATPSPIGKNCLLAFLFGGGLCAAGEVLILTATAAGVKPEQARLFASLSLIALSVLLTAFNVYDAVAHHAGAGMLVPITGFANAMASPAMEFKSEGLIIGMAAKLFSIAGPVLVYGIGTSVLYGVVLWVLGIGG